MEGQRTTKCDLITTLLGHCNSINVSVIESKVFEENTARISYASVPQMSQYCNNGLFSDKQLELIHAGIKAGIDVTAYAYPDIPEMIMSAIKDNLCKVSKYDIRYVDAHNQYSIDRRTGTTKLEALNRFNKAHTDVTVISVTEVG